MTTEEPIENPRAFPSGAIDDRFGGMSLRDYFAAQALAGWLASSPPDHGHPASCSAGMDSETVAGFSYRLADAMLAARRPEPSA